MVMQDDASVTALHARLAGTIVHNAMLAEPCQQGGVGTLDEYA